MERILDLNREVEIYLKTSVPFVMKRAIGGKIVQRLKREMKRNQQQQTWYRKIRTLIRYYSLSITPAAYVASSSEWILNTEATYHLCPIKTWFKDFRNLESDTIVMGNDQPCGIIGIGTIRYKIFDGMVRELKEIRYVPTLKKNLISVSALEAKGYKVTIENDTMKFMYEALVILQGVRCHNLYYLKGGDEANVA